MNRPFKRSGRNAGHEAPMPAGELMAIIGQIYLVVLLTLIVGVANVDMGGLISAAGVLQFGDPATATSFTA
jgi:hypothetical protein